jgi:hypothetical protein
MSDFKRRRGCNLDDVRKKDKKAPPQYKSFFFVQKALYLWFENKRDDKGTK